MKRGRCFTWQGRSKERFEHRGPEKVKKRAWKMEEGRARRRHWPAWGPPEAGARVCEDPCGYRRAEERWAGGDLREATAGRPDATRPCQPF